MSYGQDGIIEPVLATNWDIESTETGQKATFKLREGVKFHDGEMWNCGAAVLNFNHVLSDTVKQRHQWFGAGQHLKSWTCNGDYELVLETSSPFYPLLQVRISNIIELNLLFLHKNHLTCTICFYFIGTDVHSSSSLRISCSLC